MILSKIVACIYAIVVAELFDKLNLMILYVMNSTIVEPMLRILVRNLKFPTMTMKIHCIQGEFSCMIKNRCTFSKQCVMLLIVVNIKFTLQRNLRLCATFQSDVNQCTTYLGSCGSRIHHVCLLKST